MHTVIPWASLPLTEAPPTDLAVSRHSVHHTGQGAARAVADRLDRVETREEFSADLMRATLRLVDINTRFRLQLKTHLFH